MDLAIRWDLRLPNEKLSLLPKVAPAVFNTVAPAEAPEVHKLAWEEKPVAPEKNPSPKNPELARRRARSTPNLARRPCAACENPKDETKAAANEEFKQAFKAGNPSNFRPHTAAVAAQVRVPKPKKPFSKRSYSIGTLAPPFSLWPDRQDYPDHWRLASVYQHSYKPIHLRKKPLLNNLFQ